jgi:hypothetical protein
VLSGIVFMKQAYAHTHVTLSLLFHTCKASNSFLQHAKRDLIEKIEKIRENKKDIACGKTSK